MAKQMGYLMVDHRASPGLPENVARLAGYDPTLCREGKIYEADTMTCSHCGGTVVKNIFRTRERHSCAKCGGHYICDGCQYLSTLPDYVHAPMSKIIDDVRKQEALGSPMGLLLPTSKGA
jgi:hypothetical protein